MPNNDLSTTFYFSKMLNISSGMLFDMEDRLFWQQYLPCQQSLLDIGCGNGAYLSELCQRYPSTVFTGIEAEESSFNLAMQRVPDQVQLLHRRYESYHPDEQYAAMLARLVILHIPNRLHFSAWMNRHLKHNGIVFILDFADEKFEGDKQLPQFTKLFRELRAPLLPRTFLPLQDTLRLEWSQHGFVLLDSQSYQVTAEDPQMKQHLLAYMTVITEHYSAASQRESILQELKEWAANSQNFLSLPMFGLVFQKKQDEERQVLTCSTR